MSMEDYQAFNAAVGELLDDLSEAFPGVQALGALRGLHALGRRADVKLPHAKFSSEVASRYSDLLQDARANEALLRSGSYAEVPDPGVVDVIKGLWSAMGPRDRECVFQHLEVVMALHARLPSPAPSEK